MYKLLIVTSSQCNIAKDKQFYSSDSELSEIACIFKLHSHGEVAYLRFGGIKDHIGIRGTLCEVYQK